MAVYSRSPQGASDSQSLGFPSKETPQRAPTSGEALAAQAFAHVRSDPS